MNALTWQQLLCKPAFTQSHPAFSSSCIHNMSTPPQARLMPVTLHPEVHCQTVSRGSTHSTAAICTLQQALDMLLTCSKKLHHASFTVAAQASLAQSSNALNGTISLTYRHVHSTCMICRETAIAARLSRRSSLTDDRVDEVISNLTNMHSMVKLLRAGSIDKPDASRTWDVSICCTPHCVCSASHLLVQRGTSVLQQGM